MPSHTHPWRHFNSVVCRYWAIAETRHVSGSGALVLGVLFALPSAHVLLTMVRMAFDEETDPANQ